MDPLCNPNLIVITGGPGAGKTTLFRELEQRGFRGVPAGGGSAGLLARRKFGRYQNGFSHGGPEAKAISWEP